MSGDIIPDFRHAAREFAEEQALWDNGETLSYRALDRLSDDLAKRLIAGRKTLDGLLGIMLPKSADAVVTILAALKANMPYAPVDPKWPERRKSSIFQQANFDTVVTLPSYADTIDAPSSVLTTDDDDWPAIDDSLAFDANSLPTEFLGDSLGYILFTSGSTGEPKGVCVSRSAAHFFPDWARHNFELGPQDRVASLAPFTFDLSTFDIFSTLCSGACLYLVPEKTRMLPSSLSRFLEDHGITMFYAVPSNLGLLSSRGLLDKRNLSALRTVLFAGEVYPLPLFRELQALLPSNVRYCNLYGPTETNVCTYFDPAELTDADTGMPIGRPLPETELFIAGDDDEGELCVAGPTVMSGYWGREEDTSYWQIDPAGRRAYKTGDQAKLREDGNWLYFGRRDNMVKIWGYRVELGEVEACLLDLHAIEQAAVVKHSEKDAMSDTLIAFVAGKDIPTDAELLAHCKANLPPYMCPSKYFSVDTLPLSQNGKIDRRELAQRISDSVAT